MLACVWSVSIKHKYRTKREAQFVESIHIVSKFVLDDVVDVLLYCVEHCACHGTC